MNILIIESCERKKDKIHQTCIVHVRNSIIIRDYLQCDMLAHMSEIPEYLDKKYDAIICAYASPYMKYNAYMEVLNNNPQAKLFWLVNDHDVEDNILLRKWSHENERTYDMICNNAREGYRGWILRKKSGGKLLNDWIKNWYTLNLNTLIFDEKEYQNSNVPKEGIIYYGTFRKYRIKDMLDYNGLDYTLSASKKNHVKFKDAGVVASFEDKLDWEYQTKTQVFFDKHLKDYKYSLYFEDVHTHDNYAFMANRFYEAIMYNVLMLYDYRCMVTISRCDYAIDDIQIVHNAEEAANLIYKLDNDPKEYNRLLKIQQSNVEKILREREDVLMGIKNILDD